MEGYIWSNSTKRHIPTSTAGKERRVRPASDIERAIGSYGDAIWRACLLYLAPADAEDVFQDVFLKGACLV